MKTVDEIKEMWFEAYQAVVETETAAGLALDNNHYDNDTEKSDLLDIAIMCRAIIRFTEGD